MIASHPAPPSHPFGCGGAPCTNRPEHCVGSAAGQTRRKFSGFTARILLPSPAPSASKIKVFHNMTCSERKGFPSIQTFLFSWDGQSWGTSFKSVKTSNVFVERTLLGVQIPTVGSSERFGGYRFQSLHHRNPSFSAVITVYVFQGTISQKVYTP